MYKFIEPKIIYVPKSQTSDIVPVFTCKEHWEPYEAILDSIPGMNTAVKKGTPEYADIIHYWWISQVHNQFSIHEVITCEKKIDYHGEELKPGSYRGNIYFKGELDLLKKVLPEKETVIETELLQFNEKSFSRGYSEGTVIFCEIILDYFYNARNSQALKGLTGLDEYFKGTTVGKSRNVFGFLMKAIKQAYDALGFYQKTYSGLHFTAFGIQDLLNYINSHRTSYMKDIQGKDIEVIKKMGMVRIDKAPSIIKPLPQRLSFAVDKTVELPEEYMKAIRETMNFWTKSGSPLRPSDTGRITPLSPLKPIIANEYGFRGDSRSPIVIYYAGGMHPSTLRYYPNPDPKQTNPIIPKNLYHDMPHFDPWLHQTNDFTKFSVFLSISIEPEVSLNFVQMGGGNGYIYVIRAVGSVDQVATFQKTMYPEAEISLPGGADWEAVIAMRPVRKGIPEKYCYFNPNNRWRAKEKAIQDQAVYKLMNCK